MAEKDLQYGEKLNFEPGVRLYKPGDPIGQKPVFYIIAGLVKIEFKVADGSKFPLYLLPDSIFGLVEPLLNCPRLTAAYNMERSLLYCWDMEGFDIASGVSWELALSSITGLTQMLRILNAEFGERIGLIDDRILK
ncbi:hypothetical protein ES703_88105 [subsurface metagenome]